MTKQTRKELLITISKQKALILQLQTELSKKAYGRSPTVTLQTYDNIVDFCVKKQRHPEGKSKESMYSNDIIERCADLFQFFKHGKVYEKSTAVAVHWATGKSIKVGDERVSFFDALKEHHKEFHSKLHKNAKKTNEELRKWLTPK